MAVVRTVKGPAVVLSLKGGGERYLYKNAPVGSAYLESSVQHAVELGLVSEIDVPTPEEVAAADAAAAADAKAAEEKAAADAAAAAKSRTTSQK